MKCSECNGRGVAVYYVETDRDENTVTVSAREDICHTCNGSGKKTMTNADRIRSMTDEQLAEWIINGVSSDPCDYCKHNNAHCLGTLCMGKTPEEIIVEWLQLPAEECER